MSAFDKIIGYEEIKRDLIRMADTLKNREAYEHLGASAPMGLLLHGEPGYRKAKEILCKNRAFLEKIVEAYTKKEILLASDISEIKKSCEIVPVSL